MPLPKLTRTLVITPGASAGYVRDAYQPPALGTYRRRRAACPQGPKYCTCWVRVPAWGGTVRTAFRGHHPRCPSLASPSGSQRNSQRTTIGSPPGRRARRSPRPSDLPRDLPRDLPMISAWPRGDLRAISLRVIRVIAAWTESSDPTQRPRTDLCTDGPPRRV